MLFRSRVQVTCEVEKVIGDAPNNTCNLDPAPTWLIKEFHGLLSPFVVLLINVSFITGCFPAKYKQAVVFPLLKKSDADKNEPKNYRPVSNLPCLSKLLEKVAQTQLQRFLTACDKLPIHQSAYRQFHSTETALLKVLNDLLQAADRGQVSSLCLLDLKAAFDTVDHELLVLRLQRSFGIRGIALAWFISYSQV